MKAINRTTGEQVKEGQMLCPDAQGKGDIFLYPTRLTETGKSGKVYVKTPEGSEREFYASNYDLKVVE